MKKTSAGFTAAQIAAARKSGGTISLTGGSAPAKPVAATASTKPATKPATKRAATTAKVSAKTTGTAPTKVARTRKAAVASTSAASTGTGVPPIIPPPVIQPASTGQPAQAAAQPAPKLKRAWNWSMDHLKSFGNGLRKRWLLLVLLVLAIILSILAYRDRDNIAKGFDSMRTKVSNKGTTGPSKPAGTDRGQPVDKTDADVTKSQRQSGTGANGFIPHLPAATTSMGGGNSAEKITVRTRMKDVIGDGNIIGNGQVVINNQTNIVIYNGLGHSTPASAAGQVPAIHIPGTVTGPKSVQGYHWTTNLVAGQCLPYIYDRSQWKMKTSHTFTDPDLKVEVLGLDGNWHVVPSNGINTIIATGARYTVSPNATDTVQLEFWLIPRN